MQVAVPCNCGHNKNDHNKFDMYAEIGYIGWAFCKKCFILSNYKDGPVHLFKHDNLKYLEQLSNIKE